MDGGRWRVRAQTGHARHARAGHAVAGRDDWHYGRADGGGGGGGGAALRGRPAARARAVAARGDWQAHRRVKQEAAGVP
eukprot:3572851-Prymnesium_polylepis.1